VIWSSTIDVGAQLPVVVIVTAMLCIELFGGHIAAGLAETVKVGGSLTVRVAAQIPASAL
jgi:hypothetical protein